MGISESFHGVCRSRRSGNSAVARAKASVGVMLAIAAISKRSQVKITVSGTQNGEDTGYS